MIQCLKVPLLTWFPHQAGMDVTGTDVAPKMVMHAQRYTDMSLTVLECH